VAFKLVHDGQLLFASPGGGDLLAVLAAIYGAAVARDFLPIGADAEGLRLSGYISGPRLTRATRQYQYLFVNRRFVRSRQLSHALGEAYGLLLPPGKSPLCAAHFTVDPGHVDPNVHPTKIEVRFRHASTVQGLFGRACEAALAAAGFRSLTHQPRGEAGLSPYTAGALGGPDADRRRQAERLRVNPFADSLGDHDDGLGVFAPRPGEPKRAQALFAASDELPEAPQVMGQLGNRYLVAKAGADLLLIDQHRAAERVLLHALEAADRPLARQLLAVPLNLELTPTEAAAVDNHREALAGLGFELEPFGVSANLLRSIPVALVDGDYETAVRELITDLAAWETPASDDRRRAELRALVACHAATKKNRALTSEEMQRLIRDLLATDAPAVCPHGDPIIISFSLALLDRRFRR
jgi:DNA mismatch repair protein MutL